MTIDEALKLPKWAQIKVLFKDNVYDFGYIGSTGKLILYKDGDYHNTQDAIAVEPEAVTLIYPRSGRSRTEHGVGTAAEAAKVLFAESTPDAQYPFDFWQGYLVEGRVLGLDDVDFVVRSSVGYRDPPHSKPWLVFEGKGVGKGFRVTPFMMQRDATAEFIAERIMKNGPQRAIAWISTASELTRLIEQQQNKKPTFWQKMRSDAESVLKETRRKRALASIGAARQFGIPKARRENLDPATAAVIGSAIGATTTTTIQAMANPEVRAAKRRVLR